MLLAHIIASIKSICFHSSRRNLELTGIVCTSLVIACLTLLSNACTPGHPATQPSLDAQITFTRSTKPVGIIATNTPRQNSFPTAPPLSKTPGPASSTNAQTPSDLASINVPLSPTPTSTRLPPLISDLLFLSQGKLMSWDQVTDNVGILAEGVIHYSVSAKGNAIALLRTRNITANGVEQFGLDLLDLETKQITSLLDQTPLLFHVAISPDARRIKFSYQEKPGTIYTIQTGGATQSIATNQPNPSPVESGHCEAQSGTTCVGMIWSPDSQSLLWGDSRGIWISALATGGEQLIRSNKVTIKDPQNESVEIEVSFDSLVWSPAGRFALVTVAPASSHVSWQAVLDTRTGRLVQVPDSYEIDDRESNVTWMDNGDLLILHASDPANQRPPFIKIYRIFPTNNGLLVSIKDIEFQNDLLQTRFLSSELSSILFLSWPNPLDTRTLILGTATTAISFNPTLLSIDLEFKKFERLFELPEDTTDVLWSPDGQNALVLGSKGQLLFATLQGGPLRDLRSILSEHAHDFIWLPPLPRS